MKVNLKSITPNVEVNIVEIARVSSTREDKTIAPERLLNYLILNHHWSPFQHSYMTVEIITSRAIAVQYLRHLSFTFQEFSQRYAEVTDIEDIEFRSQAEKNRQSSTDVIATVTQVTPQLFSIEDITGVTPEMLHWLDKVTNNLEETLSLYQEGLKLNVAKESARMILPLATQTKLFMTGSIRSWIHLIQLREDSHAQKESQLIAKEIKKILIQECPIISKALNWN